MAFRCLHICLFTLVTLTLLPPLALSQPAFDPVAETGPLETKTEAESETTDQRLGDVVPSSNGESDPNFSQVWCDRCKTTEQPTCRTDCKDVQGRKYFVCVEECSLKRCNASCTPITADPKELERRAEKTCAQCRREFSRTCKDSCVQKRGRARSQCRKACIDSSCADTCPKKPKASPRPDSEEEDPEPLPAEQSLDEPATKQPAAKQKRKQRSKRVRKSKQPEAVTVEEIDPAIDLDDSELDAEDLEPDE